MHRALSMTAVASLAMLALGCGGAQSASSTTGPRAGIDARRLLFDYAAERVSILRPPSETIEELERTVRRARGAERIELQTKLAVANVWAAELETDERKARRQRRAAERWAAEVGRRTRDPFVDVAMELVAVLAEWRDEAPTAARTAERFTIRHTTDGAEMEVVAWLVRGEIALAGEEWDAAATAYRSLLGQLDHPLYVFALWRTAHCYRGLGRTDDARQALRDSDDMGHRTSASPQAQRVAATARAELGLPPRPPPGTEGAEPDSADGDAPGASGMSSIDNERPPE